MAPPGPVSRQSPPPSMTTVPPLNCTRQLAVEFVNIRQSFIHMVQATALLTTLFAGIQAQLLSGIPAEASPTAPQTLINALHFFSYGGLAVNIGASLSAMVFIIIVRETSSVPHHEDLGDILQNDIDTQAAREIVTISPAVDATGGDADTLIKAFLTLESLASTITSAIVWFMCVSSTICGTYCIVLQIALLAWINIAPHGSTAVFVLVTLALASAVSSVMIYMMYKCFVAFISMAIWARRAGMRRSAQQRDEQSNRSSTPAE